MPAIVSLFSRLRPLLAALALASLLASAGVASVYARNVPNIGLVQDRFVGTVGAVLGPSDSPTGLTLQLGTLKTAVRIAPRTAFAAKSAEASVEGLLAGDYAVVNAVRVQGEWVARRVTFDVQPIPPLHLFTGDVVRQSIDGKRLTIRVAATQRQVVVRIVKAVQFEMNEHPLDQPIALDKGESVQVLALHLPSGWSAYTVDVKTLTLRQNSARQS